MRGVSTIALKGDRTFISRGDKRYPAILGSIANPPEELYILGNADALCEGLSVVGARKATPYGIACTRKFASLAAKRGIVIVSGGALGCDSEAHRAALDAGGTTVCVLGGGIDQLYPKSNVPLFQRVVDSGGALVSEYPWDEPPLPFRFRQRNRIIGALGVATLICEASMPSGTFSTADEALAAGREVLAVPGSIASKTAQGPNWLIAQGATPVIDEEFFDQCLSRLFFMLRQESAAKAVQPPGMEDDPLLAALQANPMRIDEIMSSISVKRSEAPSRENYLLLHLSELESQGLVARFPDGRYGPARV